MQRFAGLGLLLVVFWLGRESSAEREPQTELVLRAGGRATIVRPGEIFLEGPDGAFVEISAGEVRRIEGNRRERMRPRVQVSGFKPGADRDAAFIAMQADHEEAYLNMSCAAVPDLDPSTAENGRSTLPFVALAATPHEGAHLRFAKDGKETLRIPAAAK